MLAALEQGSKHPNMKELRPKGTKGGAYFRALFAFDVRSRAIMLVAGDEAGNWSKWYDQNIPIADRLFSSHQERLRKEGKGAKEAKTKTGKRRRKKR